MTVVGAALALARHAGVEPPAGLFPLPTRGWRGEAMDHLLSVTWPLTHLELPGYHLNYALTDAPAQRLKILLVLLASGHGIGTRARRAAGLPRRALARAGAAPAPEPARRRSKAPGRRRATMSSSAASPVKAGVWSGSSRP